MSNVVAARPYVRAPSRRVVDTANDVIHATPTLDELTLVEQVDLARPYVAGLLALVAGLLALALGGRLYARWREENVPAVTRGSMDRRSLRKRAEDALNPFWPRYTPDQQRRIADGRAQLLARWNATPFADKRTNFHTMHRGEMLSRDEGPVDVFRAVNAPASFPDAWRRETLSLTTEARDRGFDVLVPHARYLNARWLCMSVDRPCALNTGVYLCVVGALVRLAWMLAATPTTTTI